MKILSRQVALESAMHHFILRQQDSKPIPIDLINGEKR
jgi:hypothetical protein